MKKQIRGRSARVCYGGRECGCDVWTRWARGANKFSCSQETIRVWVAWTPNFSFLGSLRSDLDISFLISLVPKDYLGHTAELLYSVVFRLFPTPDFRLTPSFWPRACSCDITTKPSTLADRHHHGLPRPRQRLQYRPPNGRIACRDCKLCYLLNSFILTTLQHYQPPPADFEEEDEQSLLHQNPMQQPRGIPYDEPYSRDQSRQQSRNQSPAGRPSYNPQDPYPQYPPPNAPPYNGNNYYQQQDTSYYNPPTGVYQVPFPSQSPGPQYGADSDSLAWEQRQAPGGPGAIRRGYGTRKVKLGQEAVLSVDYPVPSAIQNSIQAKYRNDLETGSEEFTHMRCMVITSPFVFLLISNRHRSHSRSRRVYSQERIQSQTCHVRSTHRASDRRHILQ